MASASLDLVHSRRPLQVSRGAVEDIRHLSVLCIVCSSSCNPEGFIHELVQALDCVVELRRGLAEHFDIQVAGA